jgi:hypothetical protein
MTKPGMKSKNHNLSVFLLNLLFAACILTSCKTPRQAILQPLKEQGPDYLFTQLKKNELKFNTLSLKLNVDAVIDNDNKSFSGNVFIIHDSIIWLSISKFGIEAARFLISQDTAKMINRLNSTYFVGDFDYVSSLFKVDFDFDILQALIIGNDFSYYANDVFKASVDNKNYKLSTIGRRKLKKYIKKANEEQRVLIQDIWLDPLTFKITKIMMKEVKQENRKFESFYSDFQLINEQLFPSVLKCEITDDKRIEVNITFTKTSIDKDENMPFKIPAGYTRVER